MQPNRLVFLVSTVVALAACQQESAAPASTQPNSGTIAGETAAHKSSPAITVDPASMKSCDSDIATVKWDASKAGVTTNSTEIWVGATDTDTKLFSAGGATGETKTGPWVRPGTHFFLKNKQDGKVVGEAIIGGPACH